MDYSVDFDFRTDSKGRDPDLASPSLVLYHQALWSKQLPSGKYFGLQAETGKYLLHESDLGVFQLSSDTISNSMRSHKRLASLISQIPATELDDFQALGSRIGGKLLFSGNKIDGKPTLNVARGFNSQIGDRFDLSLECIRRHYSGEKSPLTDAIERYADFFGLFETFQGYVDFFLLEDLAIDGLIEFFLPFQGEFISPRPSSLAEYQQYMEKSMSFVRARNKRINAWIFANLVDGN